jgi:hypothetical protein
MPDQGLIFIPDISGFSRFVHETEINHSRLIIQELLETIINANEIGLEISEIEGDAILFYKFGEPPELEKLYHQVEKMFCDFHRNLITYNRLQFCKCQACSSSINLTLKVISHYGEFTGYNVKNFSKLIGKDIIVAHQLLKNDIEDHEYWLVTKNLLGDNQPEGLTNWMNWNKSTKQTETGEITFQYAQLGRLKNEITPDPPVDREIVNKVKLFSLTREYDTDIITMLHAAGAPIYRNRWQVGVKQVEELYHFLPRVGMKWKTITDKGEVGMYASSYNFTPDRIEFSETDEKKKTAVYFTLQNSGVQRTKLTLDFYIAKDIATQIVFRLLKERKLKEDYSKSLNNLTRLVKELDIPTAVKT